MRTKLDFKWLFLVSLNVLLVLLIYLNSRPLKTEFPDFSFLESKLSMIESALEKPSKEPDFSPIQNNLKQLGQFIQQLNNKDDHQLGELFSTGQTALKKQLDGIAELLTKLDEQKHPVKTLPASSLPFQVLSIDSIQGVSLATIAYDFKTQALEKGDSLAGWQVVQIDFAKQRIEFENNEQAHVSLQLNTHEVKHG